MHFLIRLAISAAALAVATVLLPGSVVTWLLSVLIPDGSKDVAR